MHSPISVFALTVAAAAGAAFAQANAPTYTDVAPYTDIVPSARSSAGAPSYWKGQLSRAEVIDALRQAQRDGMVTVGDAVDYPVLIKVPTIAQSEQSQPSDAQVMGGPPLDLTGDGYRFVGGEAGWIYVGPPGAQR